MSIISLQTVQLNAQATSKEEAIRMAGELLVKAGHVAPSYVDGMLAREQTMSTYIGNGVAIPHGQFDDKGSIYSTGISAVQFLDGIVWDEDDEDEKAYLVIGIAATADEHIGVLSNLAEAIEEPEDAEKLVRASDPMEIIERLSRPQEEPM
ncbi:MAG: phosphoenolpyruvate-dependent sugar phosphotransferase system EIIA 2 [Chloroflexi bacterium]|nr:MAG: phosphoenolpyruvate-dependent sugar phosphotransferase system EIIA 2 [Chloroflexota bacterium]